METNPRSNDFTPTISVVWFGVVVVFLSEIVL